MLTKCVSEEKQMFVLTCGMRVTHNVKHMLCEQEKASEKKKQKQFLDSVCDNYERAGASNNELEMCIKEAIYRISLQVYNVCDFNGLRGIACPDVVVVLGRGTLRVAEDDDNNNIITALIQHNVEREKPRWLQFYILDFDYHSGVSIQQLYWTGDELKLHTIAPLTHQWKDLLPAVLAIDLDRVAMRKRVREQEECVSASESKRRKTHDDDDSD